MGKSQDWRLKSYPDTINLVEIKERTREIAGRALHRLGIIVEGAGDREFTATVVVWRRRVGRPEDPDSAQILLNGRNLWQAIWSAGQNGLEAVTRNGERVTVLPEEAIPDILTPKPKLRPKA